MYVIDTSAMKKKKHSLGFAMRLKVPCSVVRWRRSQPTR
jgi:hypothetical protein